MALDPLGGGGMPQPTVANPLQGKDLLAELLKLQQQGTRGTQPVANYRRSAPGTIAQRYRPPGQMQVRFPWARPQRGA